MQKKSKNSLMISFVVYKSAENDINAAENGYNMTYAKRVDLYM